MKRAKPKRAVSVTEFIRLVQQAQERGAPLRFLPLDAPGYEWVIRRSSRPVWVTDSFALARDLVVALAQNADGVQGAPTYKLEQTPAGGPLRAFVDASKKALANEGSHPREGGYFADVKWCAKFAESHGSTPRYYTTAEVGRILPAHVASKDTLRVACAKKKGRRVEGANRNNDRKIWQATREAWVAYFGDALGEADWWRLSR